MEKMKAYFHTKYIDLIGQTNLVGRGSNGQSLWDCEKKCDLVEVMAL